MHHLTVFDCPGRQHYGNPPAWHHVRLYMQTTVTTCCPRLSSVPSITRRRQKSCTKRSARLVHLLLLRTPLSCLILPSIGHPRLGGAHGVVMPVALHHRVIACLPLLQAVQTAKARLAWQRWCCAVPCCLYALYSNRLQTCRVRTVVNNGVLVVLCCLQCGWAGLPDAGHPACQESSS